MVKTVKNGNVNGMKWLLATMGGLVLNVNGESTRDSFFVVSGPKTAGCIPLVDVHVSQWYDDPHKCKYYKIKENHKIVSFALLSKNDFDPLKQHTLPYTLNYIYTFPEYRHKGYALCILETIKYHDEVTAFSECADLFKKAGYIQVGPEVYRSQ
jgi:hypothetical protein